MEFQEHVEFGGFPNCVRLANAEIELVATTDVGPRVLRLGFQGGRNLFHTFAGDAGQTDGDSWRSFGGHRLWHAPEVAPRTYAPDNAPVPYRWDGQTLHLGPTREAENGLEKAIAITLEPASNHVRLVHELTNVGPWAIELAAWTLSVMATGGRAIFPQAPFIPHPDVLAPARPLVLWHFTDMADPRWTWGTKYIQLRQEPGNGKKQKVGMLDQQGWAAYTLEGDVFIKRFGYEAHAPYADFGCNLETYTDAEMLEVESLGPLARLAPGETLRHVEDWYLAHAAVGDDEAAIDRVLLPLVEQTRHAG